MDRPALDCSHLSAAGPDKPYLQDEATLTPVLTMSRSPETTTARWTSERECQARGLLSPRWSQRPADEVGGWVAAAVWAALSPVVRPPLPLEESALAWSRRQLNRQIECMYRLLFTSEPAQHGGSRGVQQVVAPEVVCQRVKLGQGLLRTGRFR